MGTDVVQITVAKALECPGSGSDKPSDMMLDWVPVKGDNRGSEGTALSLQMPPGICRRGR